MSDSSRFDRYRSERDCHRFDHEKSRLLSSRENRYLKKNRTTEKYREKYRQELVKERSIYDSSKKFSEDSDRFDSDRFGLVRDRFRSDQEDRLTRIDSYRSRSL